MQTADQNEPRNASAKGSEESAAPGHDGTVQPYPRIELTPEPKWAAKSKTVIGAVVAALPAIASLLGIEVADEEVQRMGGALLTLLGTVLAIWGRITAKAPLSFSNPNPPARLWLLLILLALPGCAALDGAMVTATYDKNGPRVSLSKTFGSDGKVIKPPRASKQHRNRAGSAPALAETTKRGVAPAQPAKAGGATLALAWRALL